MGGEQRACPHCGAPLEAVTMDVGGRRVYAGWKACGCDGAQAERRAAMAEEERRRHDEEERVRAARRSRAGIPARFAKADSPLAGAIVESVLARGVGAYVVGGVGSGKTHLACAVARELCDGGRFVRFTTAVGMLDRCKASWSGGTPEDAVLSPLERCDLLVLDDLGKEVPSEWALGRLFRVVNARYAEMRPIVCTSQYGRAALARRLGRNDPETAKAVASRLAEMCEVVELGGGDRRLGGGDEG